MALVGNLRDFGLSDFLYLVDRGHKTGMLVLERPGDEARLFFVNGKLVYAVQNATEEKLGDLLLKANKLTQEQRDYALQLQQTTARDKPFGLILVELGYITREGIIRAVRNQIEDRVYRLFGWTEGEFRFEPDVAAPRESVTIPLGIENIIMEGVRRMDEWTQIKDRIPTLDLVVRFTEQPVERSKGVNLTPDEWRVFARINGEDDIATIAYTAGISEFEVCKIIYGFIQAGLVETTRLQPPPVAPPQRSGAASPLSTTLLRDLPSMQQPGRTMRSMQTNAQPATAAALPAPGWGRPRQQTSRGLLQRIVDVIRGL